MTCRNSSNSLRLIIVALSDRPVFTTSHESNYPMPAGVTLVFGRSVEERSEFAGATLAASADDSFEVVAQEREAFEWSHPTTGRSGRVRVRSDRDLEAFVALLGDSAVIDVTGLSHHIWAPMVRSCVKRLRSLRCLYVEPLSYKRHTAPTEYELFDLSESIEGVAPIPGFATLGAYDDFLFAPLLGFEGRRLAYVLSEIEPRDDRIHPVIGVPGFRPEFPFFAYEGNRLALEDTGAFSQVSYARANCPFSLFYALEDLAIYNPDVPMAVALIGTKPHSLGGVLFALFSGRPVEIVYDYPVRKVQRTTGHARILEYHISAFADWVR